MTFGEMGLGDCMPFRILKIYSAYSTLSLGWGGVAEGDYRSYMYWGTLHVGRLGLG